MNVSTPGVSLMQALEHIDDPRQTSNGTLHDFREILVIAICAMLCDNDTFEEMVAWARYKQDWLQRFLSLKHGIPSEDTFLRIFRLMDPKQFECA
ncbi:ISAs1 family transposase, partial [Chromobacterium alticapitis]